jgi:aspartyl-tRNA synthetase
MVSGLDKYFQVARCFRDEDVRDDRQPEFTQIDVEMSFVEEEDIFDMVHSLFKLIWKEMKGEDISFQRLSYEDALTKYGTDAPDLRYGLEMKDVTDLVSNSGYKIFLDIAKKGGKVRCMKAENCKDRISKKLANKLIAEVIKNAGAKGLTWIYVEDDKLKSIPEPIAESFSSDLQSALIERMDAKNGDVLFFIADEPKKSMYIGGKARVQIANMLGLIDGSKYSFVWIEHFPLFEDSEGGRPTSKHHPFTAPDASTIEYLDKDVSKVRSKAYDVVVNGTEIGGGSIRIHDANMQEKILKILGISDAEIEKEFGFLMEALRYGAPPHGGFALGLDRLVAVLVGTDNLRDVILFPKTKKFYSPVDDAPTSIKEDQLKELHIIAFGDEE